MWKKVFEALDRNTAWRVFRHAKALGDIFTYFGLPAWIASGAAIIAGGAVTWVSYLPIWAKVLVGLLVILLVLLLGFVISLLAATKLSQEEEKPLEITRKREWTKEITAGLSIVAALILAAVMSTKTRSISPAPPSTQPTQTSKTQTMPPVTPPAPEHKMEAKQAIPKARTKPPAHVTDGKNKEPLPDIRVNKIEQKQAPCSGGIAMGGGTANGGNCGPPPSEVRITKLVDNELEKGLYVTQFRIAVTGSAVPELSATIDNPEITEIIFLAGQGAGMSVGPAQEDISKPRTRTLPNMFGIATLQFRSTKPLPKDFVQFGCGGAECTITPQ